MIQSGPWRRMGMALGVNLVITWILPGLSAADEGQPRTLPRDTAILELVLPAGARVTLDGAEKGTQRRFEVRSLEPRRYSAHQVRILFADGKEAQRQVLLEGGWAVNLPVQSPGGTLPELVLQTGHTQTAWCVAFSPDTRFLVTGASDGIANLWDVTTGLRLRAYPHEDGLMAVAFSPDSRRILTGTENGTVSVWEVASGKLLARREKTHKTLYSAEYSSDGKSILTAGGKRPDPGGVVASGEARLWDGDLTSQDQEYPSRRSPIRIARLSPDGSGVLTGNASNVHGETEVVLWDRKTAQPRWRCPIQNGESVERVLWSPDGRHVLFMAGIKAVLLDARTGLPVRSLQDDAHPVANQGMTFNADGTRLLTSTLLSGATATELSHWDVKTGKVLQRQRVEEASTDRRTTPLCKWTLSPDGLYAAQSQEGGSVVLWDATAGVVLRRLEGKSTVVRTLAVSPDSKQLLVASEGHRAVLWNLEAGQPERILEVNQRSSYGPTGNWISEVAFSRDGRHLLTSAHYRGTTLWDRASGKAVRTFESTNSWGFVDSVRFSPDDSKLAMGSYWDTFLWDVPSGKKDWSYKVPSIYLRSMAIAFRPDGKQLVVGHGGGNSGAAVVLDAVTGKDLGIVLKHEKSVRSVAYSPDGKFILTASNDQTVVLWDAATGKPIHVFRGPPAGSGVARYSPNGQLVVAGFEDGTLILWEASTRRQLRVLRGHGSAVLTAGFTPDGRRLFTGSVDGTARLWDLATGDELARIISMEGGRHWAVVTPEGLFDGSRGGREQVSFRVGEGLNMVSLDRFFQDGYYPGLLAELWRGERPMPGQALPTNPAPLVKILPQPDSERKDRVLIDVAVTDQGGGIKGPWLQHNSATLSSGALVKREGKTAHHRYSIALVPGDNRIEVGAATADGGRESDPVRLILRFDGKLLEPELYVVAVGINRYAAGAGVGNLDFCVKDAEAVARLFQERTGKLYKQVHVTQLLNEQASKAGIVQAVRDVAKKAQSQDTLVVYVASHGITVGQRFYLIPHDFQLARADQLPDQPKPVTTGVGLRGYRDVSEQREAAIRAKGLAIDELGEALAEVPALKRVLIFDTCYSGSAIQLAGKPNNPFAFRGAVERFSRAQGVYSLSATAADALAGEPKELGHGILTYTLLAGMGAIENGPLVGKVLAPDAKQLVDVLQWFGYARKQVPALYTEYYKRPQQVEVGGDDQPTFPLLVPVAQ